MDRIEKKLVIKVEATFSAESEAELHELLGCVKASTEITVSGQAIQQLENSVAIKGTWKRSFKLEDVPVVAEPPPPPPMPSPEELRKWGTY